MNRRSNYSSNQSYSSGREDFGSNTPQSRGWGETQAARKRSTRPDEEIRDEILEAIAWNDEVDVSNIKVEVRGGKVILVGAVSDQNMKRLIEELIEDISGVRSIQNRLTLK